MSNPGTLYVVATPLGNLEDLSAHAARCLRDVDAIYAEDTRRSRILLSHLGIERTIRSLHEHNERVRADEVIALLGEGKSAAFVTDAGTPAVSDPGAELVARVAEAGLTVSPVAGPSALAAALSVAGFPGAREGVLFLGFLAADGPERRSALEAIGRHRGIVVLYEAPHRLKATLDALAQIEPSRPACACRELTKLHEEIRRGTVSELAQWAQGEVRGELTLVLGPTTLAPVKADDEAVDRALERCLAAGLSARDAAAAVAAVLERSRREVYARCQALQRRG